MNLRLFQVTKSKELRSKLGGIFKPTTTHPARPFVRDLQESPAKSFPQNKVTYWVTFVFFLLD
jgi:hypothetical protein